MDATNLDETRIAALRNEAAEAGDMELVAACDRVLAVGGSNTSPFRCWEDSQEDKDALDKVLHAINSAEAME